MKKLKRVKILSPFENIAKKILGSSDYKNAKGVMREILVKTVNEDLSNDAAKIKVPTILIYGDMDMEVPYEDTKEYERLMSDCGLIIYEGCTHYAYLERLNQTINIINNFIK